MSARLAIRPLAPGDFTAWEPLWQGYLAFYESNVPDETTRVTFARLVSADEPMGGFLAWNEAGAAVGMTHWIDHRSCWTAGNYCYLQDLFVSPGARGTGAGRALIEAVRQAAHARGCSRVHWLTHETNSAAAGLYDQIAQRSGFVQYRQLL
jgi:GNAT superfamily N-acetyltransferase